MVDILLLLASLLSGFLLTGAVVVLFFRVRRAKTLKVLEKQVHNAGETLRLAVTSARYSGAEFGYSQAKNSGLLAVGDQRLYFQHFLEKTPSIVIPLADIRHVTVEASFRGETRALAGGGYLVVHTGEGNRIGFLLKAPESICELLRVS